MADEARVCDLVEQALNDQLTPEEACAHDPELLREVTARLDECRNVERMLERMFPSDTPSRSLPLMGLLESRLPTIAGYEVLGVLGRGGSGVIYRVRHLKLNRVVALKMLLSGSYASAPELLRFTREAEAVASLSHPNIVPVHDVGDVDGRPYYTMEFIEGGSLAQKLAGVPQPALRCATTVTTLAGAVGTAHQHGIIHRDLKPGNVLLTADGTPKITDFGLARHFDGDGGLTLDGVRVGTPSYMSPEQVRGQAGAVGPAADIYALGAILYEMLTGRPPFRAATATETQRQVIDEEPATPSRVNTKVPRDLETICLKCLHKDPGRRYSTAAALADDLRRFLKGEPITARPTGSLERVAKWAQRRPSSAAMILAGAAITLLLIVGAVWLTLERGKLTHAVEADLRDVAELAQQARWAEARLALERAHARLGRVAGSEVRQRVAQAKTNLDLATSLDDVRLSRVTGGQLIFYKRKANERYTEIFQRAGLGTFHDEANDVAARVRASAIRTALVTALDDWAVCATDESQRNWVISVARAGGPDANGWRDRILDRASWADAAALSELARTMPPRECSVSLQLALGERLRDAGGDATPLLRRVQNEHPDDFWVNLILGNALLYRATGEAREYYRVALASRPQAAVGYCALGDALRLQESFEEATRYYQLAIDRDPNYARVYTNLGLTLRTQGKVDQAIRFYKKSVELDPNYAWAYANLGTAYRDIGRLEDAAAQYHKALALEPDNASIQNELRTVQVRQGQAQEVWAAWSRIIQTDPPSYEAWWGYSELTVFLGKADEYKRTRQRLLKRFGESTDPIITERVGRACLLMPGSAEETQQAADLVARAIAAKGAVSDWIYPYFLFAKALAEYRQGRPENTIAILTGDAAKILGPAPQLLLAMAQERQGDTQTARRTLAAAVESFDWRLSEADSRDIWMYHILRREAEAAILPNELTSHPASRPTTAADPGKDLMNVAPNDHRKPGSGVSAASRN
jgi:serine/threonine-protein kinase